VDEGEFSRKRPSGVVATSVTAHCGDAPDVAPSHPAFLAKTGAILFLKQALTLLRPGRPHSDVSAAARPGAIREIAQSNAGLEVANSWVKAALPRSKRLREVQETSKLSLSNAQIAELLSQASEAATGHLQRALRKATQAAFLWPVEAGELLAKKESLQQLARIGPHLARLIQRWCEAPPPLPELSPLRQNFLTTAQAKRILAKRPQWADQYHGDLQMHSNWSDGSGKIKDMADAARKRGYEYIAMTDHSQGLKIAGGMDEQELAEQAEEIETLNAKLKASQQNFRVLKSIEMNLSPEGQGDMDPKALKKLDLVVGSFHSKLRVTGDQTERYLSALRNPSIQILGHPRGRIYNRRLGLTADWPRVFAEAARLNKVIEVDSYPDRQDLDVELLLVAKKEGCLIAIDTDAHAPDQLAWVELGLAATLLAGIPAERVINFLSATELLKWAKSVKSQ
jgi:putative hydrolase